METQSSFVDPKTVRMRLGELIAPHDWSLYRVVLREAQARGLRFALGGGMAYSAYAQRWRDTKDMDLYVLPDERQPMIDVVRSAGFSDYFERVPYDRQWIFRAYREGVIVDVIWQMANQRAVVNESWLTRGLEISLRGLPVRLLSVEELIWAKLYVLQRERCDWPDLLNLIYAQGPQMDWAYLLGQLGDDAAVLGGVMRVFSWMCPQRARQIPEEIWERMGLLKPSSGPDCREDRHRIRLLDSRDWFGPKAEDV